MIINNDAFLIKEHPNFNPITEKHQRLEYWRTIKRRCMEGYWVGGKWMPGELYTYINTWHIKLNDKARKNAGKIISRPWLRDIDWEKFYIASEAFGFSGFELDTKNTCDIRYDPNLKSYHLATQAITEAEFNSKKYIPAREYLRMNHGTNLGKPLYKNPAKNVIDIEARGGGKSYTASCLIYHNFILDGSHDYDAYMEARKVKQPMTSETLVGAIHAMYSTDLIDKFKVGYENLPGQYEYMAEKYFSPLHINVTGSYEPGKKGALNTVSNSKLHHRTFNESPFAGNGTRPSKAFLEEIGLFHRLIETLGAMKDTTMDGTFKFGTIWMFGTGGAMQSGATVAAQKVFYNPEEYDCLVFEDLWENRGRIGYFVPADLAINDFKKGPNNVTDLDLANIVLTEESKKLEKAKDQKPYQDNLQNRPRKPSDAFLITGNNKFPVKDLDINIQRLTKSARILSSNWTGFVVSSNDGSNTVKWQNSNDRPFREWPPDQRDNEYGCIEIFEHPKPMREGIPYTTRYIAAVDPVDDDGVVGSLQSCLIFDLYTERIVAEYTGRTPIVDEWYENTRLLLIYYNAVCLYESSKKGFYAHFRNKFSLHLLAKVPSVLSNMDVSNYDPSGENKQYGCPATTAINEFGRNVYNAWLRRQATSKDDGVTNAMCLNSLGLSIETKNYSNQGNFDRVSAAEKLFILYADFMYLLGGEKAVWGDTTQLEVKKTVKVDDENNVYNKYLKQLAKKGYVNNSSQEVNRLYRTPSPNSSYKSQDFSTVDY